MKKLSILCAFALVFGLMAGQAFATSYCKDYLESGNPGGAGTCSITTVACMSDADCILAGTEVCVPQSLKTFDEEVTLFESETILVDIWVNDIDNGDVLLTGGFEIYWDPSIEVLSVTAAGYWGTVVPDSREGYYNLQMLHDSQLSHDAGDDVYLARLEIHCLEFGEDYMTVQPIIGPPQLDSVVSADDGFVYDTVIEPNVFTFHQLKPCTADLSCDDGNYCNGDETCNLSGGSPGVCEPGTDVDCADGDYCNGDETCNEDTDSCDAGTSVDCADGVYCNGDETCNETSDDCDAGINPCEPETECNTCDEAGGDCTDPAGTECTSDGNECTDNECDGAGVCAAINNTDPCNDGEYCNGADTCIDGACDDHAGDPCAAGDGEYCNGVEACNEGPDVCDSPGNPCPANDSEYCNGTENTCNEGGDDCGSTVPCPVDDGVYCNGAETCNDTTDACEIIDPTPCDDEDPCTDDECFEGDHCTHTCNAQSASDPCCELAPCDETTICQAAGYLDIGDQWANCGDVGVKIPICLINLEDEVGAVQVDLCEDPDCLICVGCEMTERTTIFDCMVNELENGCCALIIFSKNPGGVLNPGECDIVIIDYTLKDDPECCTTCIIIVPENIVVVDQYGYDVEILTDDTYGNGMVCPFECGDVEPAASTAGAYDCGDGDVDIFDILEEVDFIIHVKEPDACQAIRADTPTGTPPYCIDPDGNISVADLMVIIDMALGRQDCCSYYYGGVIY